MADLTGIKNIVFDFGGVIVDLDRERCIEAFERLGINVRDALGQYAQSGVFSGIETGELDIEEFCDALRRIAGRPDIPDRKITNAWNEFLVGIPSPRLECLSRLTDKFHLYLLSNTNRVHWALATNDLFLYHGRTVDWYFEKIFLSYKLGITKPDKRMYQTVVKETGIKPGETLYIDDCEENCNAAAKEGFKTFHSVKESDWMELFKNIQ